MPDEASDVLMNLNVQIAQKEQHRDDDAVQFFQRHLSEHLVFRRADGSVVGKRGAGNPKGFMEALAGPNPFSRRESEDVDVTVLSERAVVSLIVEVTRKDDGSVHRYRNIRFWSHNGDDWQVDSWYNFELIENEGHNGG